MRRLVLSSGTLALIGGILALLAAGGGYAIASSGHRSDRQTGTRQPAPAVAPSPTKHKPATPAYAQVVWNSGTGTATMRAKHNMGSATVVAEGLGGFCFQNLPFTAQNAVATIDWANGSSEEDTAQVAISKGTALSCTTGQHVRVETINASTDTEEHASFFIYFN